MNSHIIKCSFFNLTTREMCLMLLSSTEKKKVKRGTQRNKAVLRRATMPNSTTDTENKTPQGKEYTAKQC